jgi:hypothetical protein
MYRKLGIALMILAAGVLSAQIYENKEGFGELEDCGQLKKTPTLTLSGIRRNTGR